MGIDAYKGVAQQAFVQTGATQHRDYAPDAIIAPMLAIARQADPATIGFQPPLSALSERRFSLEESRTLVMAALDAFDPVLGDKAREILRTAHYNNGASDRQAEARYRASPYDGSGHMVENPFLDKDYALQVNEGARWNLMPVAAGQCRLMRCLPAESDQKQWTETAFDPANPHSKAVIEYQFDGTIDAVIHMAHELGHAIADDYGHEAGHSYRENPPHIVEMQAYLTQHILYDHLKRHPDPQIAQAAQGHFTATINRNLADLPNDPGMEGRPVSILAIRALHDHLRAQALETRHHVSEVLLGRAGPKNINEVLAEAGIQRPEEMETLARSAMRLAGETVTQAQGAPKTPEPVSMVLGR